MKNAKLENLFKLNSKVTIIVPATINITEEIDNTEYVEEVATLFSECFGGATATQTLGYWNSPTMGLVKEKSTTVFAYCKESDLMANIDRVIEKAEELRDRLKQDAVAMEINGEMYFI